jgi:hypothetical protein
MSCAQDKVKCFLTEHWWGLERTGSLSTEPAISFFLWEQRCLAGGSDFFGDILGGIGLESLMFL